MFFVINFAAILENILRHNTVSIIHASFQIGERSVKHKSVGGRPRCVPFLEFRV